MDNFAEARQRDVLNLAEEMEDSLDKDAKFLEGIFQRIDEDGSGQVTFEELVEGARKDKEFQSRRPRDIYVYKWRGGVRRCEGKGDSHVERRALKGLVIGRLVALERWNARLRVMDIDEEDLLQLFVPRLLAPRRWRFKGRLST